MTWCESQSRTSATFPKMQLYRPCRGGLKKVFGILCLVATLYFTILCFTNISSKPRPKFIAITSHPFPFYPQTHETVCRLAWSPRTSTRSAATRKFTSTTAKCRWSLSAACPGPERRSWGRCSTPIPTSGMWAVFLHLVRHINSEISPTTAVMGWFFLQIYRLTDFVIAAVLYTVGYGGLGSLNKHSFWCLTHRVIGVIFFIT